MIRQLYRGTGGWGQIVTPAAYIDLPPIFRGFSEILAGFVVRCSGLVWSVICYACLNQLRLELRKYLILKRIVWVRRCWR